MKKLEHSSERINGERVAKRKFCKLGITGAVLLGALNFGAVTSFFVPRAVQAQEQVELQGKKLTVVKLDKTLAELDKETQKYRGEEYFPSEEIPSYSTHVKVPDEVVYLVTLRPRGGDNTLVMLFPAERDLKNKDPKTKGKGLLSLNEFAGYVREISGKDMERVKIILEHGTFDYKGKETTYTNAYIFPLDADGKILTRRGNGEYVVYTGVYYADTAGGGLNLIIEPYNRDTLARR